MDEEENICCTGQAQRVNVTRTFRTVATIRNELHYGGTSLVTWMRKRPTGVAGALQALRPHRSVGAMVVDDPALWLEQ